MENPSDPISLQNGDVNQLLHQFEEGKGADIILDEEENEIIFEEDEEEDILMDEEDDILMDVDVDVDVDGDILMDEEDDIRVFDDEKIEDFPVIDVLTFKSVSDCDGLVSLN
jgi:hypothetical protein